MNRFLRATTFAVIAAAGLLAHAQTKIVFLGTGEPSPTWRRQGPSFVVVAGGNTYLFDFGVGVMRQANHAGVNISPPKAAFLSHLHTDHTLGLPDLMFTPWSSGATTTSSFPLYGPAGLQWMVTNIQNAYTQDVCIRSNCQFFGVNSYKPPVVNEITLKDYPKGGPSPPPAGGSAPKCEKCDQTCPPGDNCTCGAELSKSSPKQVYTDSAVTVSAFLVRHGCWDEAFGYVIETASDHKKIVYSGDTRYVANMGIACNGCDVLIHELWWGSGTAACGKGNYMPCFHTSIAGLRQVYAEAKPKKLVVTHQVGSGTAGELGIAECASPASKNCVYFANDLDTVAP
jgi:ribonuclease BN (tRNA processing enzyme)